MVHKRKTRRRRRKQTGGLLVPNVFPFLRLIEKANKVVVPLALDRLGKRRAARDLRRTPLLFGKRTHLPL